VPAFLPEEYVPAVDDRVRLYRRLAGALTPEGVERLIADVTSAFGAPPVPAANLLAVARIRTLAAQAGIAHVSLVRGRLQFSPLRLTAAESGRLAKLGGIYSEKDLRLAVPTPPGTGPAEAASTVLDAILDAVAHSRSGDSSA
jgi:transcription-repair coupling factor (superfamily II helicase)